MEPALRRDARTGIGDLDTQTGPASPTTRHSKTPPLAVNFTALPSRLSSTCRTRVGSIMTQSGKAGAIRIDAIAAADDSDFQVILMDVRMPGMTGLEATRHIRALPNARSQVPIIALTAQSFAEQIAECHASGMDSYLAKPFTMDALLGAVGDAVHVGGPDAIDGDRAAASPPRIRTRRLSPAGPGLVQADGEHAHAGGPGPQSRHRRRPYRDLAVDPEHARSAGGGAPVA